MRSRSLLVTSLLILATTSAHAQQVVNLPAKDRPLAGQARTLFTVGREDGDTPDVFGSVADVAFDAAGNLYVLDSMAKRVVVFDAAGKFVREFGRDGRGPGEFTRPSAIVVRNDGTIIVRDGGARGFHLFDRTGKYVRTMPQSTDLPSPIVFARVHPQGVITEGLAMMFVNGAPTQLDYIPLLLHPFAENTKPSKLFEMPATKPEVKTSGTPAAGGSFSVNFKRKLHEMMPSWGVLPTGALAIAHTPAYEVQVTSPAGRVERVIKRDIPARKWSAKDRAAARDELLESLQNGGVRSMSNGRSEQVKLTKPEIDKRMAEAEFADIVAPIKHITVDDAGRIWIMRTGKLVVDDGDIDILSPDLRYLGTLPTQKLPNVFGPGDRAAYVVTDDLGVNRVLVKDLTSIFR